MVTRRDYDAIEASSSLRRRLGLCVAVPCAALALWLAADRGGSFLTTADGAMRQPPSQLSRDRPGFGDVAPLTESLDSSDADVVTLPPLVTQYAHLLAPEGHLKSFLSWNGGVQGPTRRVRVNQTVRVKLTNDAWSDGVTCHHHGIHQIGTPYYDGSAQIAQPILAPGLSMTYEFKAWPPGTHWYHSHAALQLGDGLKGLFIVEDPNDPWRHFYSTDAALMFYEWAWQTELDMWVSKEVPSWVTETGVVNGVVSSNTSGTTTGYVVEVGAGRTIRLRLCYAGVAYAVGVSVDRHNMTVIAKDGADVAPLRVGKVIVHAAERFDVLVHVSDEPGDYIINFDARQDEAEYFPPTGHHAIPNADLYEGSKYGHWNATLRVRAAGAAAEGDAAAADSSEAGDDAVVSTDDDDHAAHAERAMPYVGAFVEQLDLTHITHRAMNMVTQEMDVILEPTLKGRALGPDERVPSSADRQIPLTLTGRMPWLEKGEHIKAATPTTSSRGAWMVNNISWVDPSAPLYLTKGECCVVDEPKKNYGTHVIDIKLGEVVDLVVVVPRQNGEWPFTHPLHLHGYKFWVVATGKLPFVNRSADTYNLVDPLRADT